jgi:hypothetical protein
VPWPSKQDSSRTEQAASTTRRPWRETGVGALRGDADPAVDAELIGDTAATSRSNDQVTHAEQANVPLGVWPVADGLPPSARGASIRVI